MTASLLRALVGASDQLRAAYLAADDAVLRKQIEQVAGAIAQLIGVAVTGRGEPVEETAS